MMKFSSDIAIFGGGIAGLWLLNRLRQSGCDAILFETQALGCGQTTRSQGIIHGGMKYALQGMLTNDAVAMADMPALWRECLQGKGEIDLSRVNVLSQQHYLWAANKLTAKLGGFLAGAALTSRVAALDKKDYPTVFHHAKFKGEVYALDEIVLDVPTLVRELAKPYADYIFKIDGIQENDLHLASANNLDYVIVRANGQEGQVHAKQFVFTAGEGNEVVVSKLNQPTLAAQRRPLHMVMVKTPFKHPLYAHCVGMGARPRITITTHYTSDGDAVWYLGGLLSETGVDKTSEQQIAAAREELMSLFPWLDFTGAEFATFKIDRAEPLQKNGMKPETSFCQTFGNITIGWPTKLALAPKLAAEIMSQCMERGLTRFSGSDPLSMDPDFRRDDACAGYTWPHPPVATPAWEDVFCK